MITVVAISSEQDMDNANKWLAHLPSFVNKLIVRTVKKGETRKVSGRDGIAFHDWGYEDFRFDEARNHALSLVETDWCIMLDIDERLQIFQSDIDYIESQPKNVAGLQALISWYNEDQGQQAIISTKVLRKEVRYKYSCHEDPKPWIYDNGFKIGKSPVMIRHLGYDTKERRQDSLLRNYHLILSDLFRNPTDSKSMFDMKRTLTGMSNVNNE